MSPAVVMFTLAAAHRLSDRVSVVALIASGAPVGRAAALHQLHPSELVGLERQDMSVPRPRVHIRQAQVDDELDDTKAGKADRMIIFDKQTAAVPGEHPAGVTVSWTTHDLLALDQNRWATFSVVVLVMNKALGITLRALDYETEKFGTGGAWLVAVTMSPGSEADPR